MSSCRGRRQGLGQAPGRQAGGQAARQGALRTGWMRNWIQQRCTGHDVLQIAAAALQEGSHHLLCAGVAGKCARGALGRLQIAFLRSWQPRRELGAPAARPRRPSRPLLSLGHPSSRTRCVRGFGAAPSRLDAREGPPRRPGAVRLPTALTRGPAHAAPPLPPSRHSRQPTQRRQGAQGSQARPPVACSPSRAPGGPARSPAAAANHAQAPRALPAARLQPRPPPRAAATTRPAPTQPALP